MLSAGEPVAVGCRRLPWGTLASRCKAYRAPPMAPDAFEQMMREGTASRALNFTNGKDATSICIPQCQLAFKRLLSTTEELS